MQDIECVRWALSKGASPKIIKKELPNNSVLSVAAHTGNVEIIKELMKIGKLYLKIHSFVPQTTL